MGVGDVRAVAHQAADFGSLTERIDRRYPMVSRQRNELYAAVVGQGAGSDQEGINWLLRKARKDRIDVANGAGVEDFNLPPNGQSRSPNVRDNALGRGPLGIGEHANARGFRPQFTQEPKLLCSKFRRDETDTGDV